MKQGKKAVVFTLGCKVNDVESSSIIRGLEGIGYTVSREMTDADVYVINTCAVTAEAERKSRQMVSKALKQNDGATVLVCGCASHLSPTDFFDKSERVAFVTGAQKKNAVLAYAERLATTIERKNEVVNGETEYEEMLPPERMKTRAFVKVQDGCNRFCSYCIIPYLRGRSRSRNLESAKREILSSSAEETVVTGIDVSDYKDGAGNDLTALMLAVKDAKTRIRLGSMEVSLITPSFLSALKQIQNFAPQFHLSLQSGANEVLKSMNRKYTRERYLEACDAIYTAFPGASITTDIIVGFPTETEEHFLDTLAMIREAKFAQIHAFPYSPRKGTNAYKKYKELPPSVKRDRLERVLKEGEKQKQAYLLGLIGTVKELVPETYEDGVTDGHLENYAHAYLVGKTDKTRKKVRVIGLYKDGVEVVLEE